MEQRWNRPLNVAPGHWKKQLPGKYLAIAAKGDVPTLQALLTEHPGFLNKRGSHNRTLLREAVRAEKAAAVAFLAERRPISILFSKSSHVWLFQNQNYPQ